MYKSVGFSDCEYKVLKREAWSEIAGRFRVCEERNKIL
jgi:hypothetical protein